MENPYQVLHLEREACPEEVKQDRIITGLLRLEAERLWEELRTQVEDIHHEHTRR